MHRRDVSRGTLSETDGETNEARKEGIPHDQGNARDSNTRPQHAPKLMRKQTLPYVLPAYAPTRSSHLPSNFSLTAHPCLTYPTRIPLAQTPLTYCLSPSSQALMKGKRSPIRMGAGTYLCPHAIVTCAQFPFFGGIASANPHLTYLSRPSLLPETALRMRLPAQSTDERANAPIRMLDPLCVPFWIHAIVTCAQFPFFRGFNTIEAYVHGRMYVRVCGVLGTLSWP